MIPLQITGGAALRQIQLSDIEPLTRLSCDPSIKRTYWRNADVDVEKSWEAQFAYEQLFPNPHQIKYGHVFVIETAAKEIAGAAGFVLSPYSYRQQMRPGHTVTMNYFVGKQFQGNGLAARALVALKPYLFDSLEAEVLIAECLISNHASRKTLCNAGFFEHTAGDKLLLTDGTEVIPAFKSSSAEECIYSLSNREFQTKTQRARQNHTAQIR